MHTWVARAFLPVLLFFPLSAQKQAFNVQAMMQLARISDPQLSPDGHSVAFTVQTIDIANNTRPKQIYVVAMDGGAPRKIADAAERPRWAPDSKRIAFISDRGGSSQIWMIDADGANARQLTNLSTEAGGVLYARDGKSLVFTSEVYPECGADDACNKQRLDADKNNKVKARSINALLYRHWTAWQGSRRSHLLVIPVSGGAARDLTPGTRDVPPFSLGGPEDYAISPDGMEVCYALNADDVPALSTNTDLYVVPVAGGPSKKITVNPAADNSPQYSPDGKYLAFRSQARPGYESDRWRLMVLERATGKLTNLTETLDRWVESFAWWPDSSHLFFAVQDRGRQSIQFIAVAGGGARVALSGDSSLDDMQITPDGKMMIYTRQSGSSPAEIFRAASDGGTETALTRLNEGV
ncbi:MAG TPA: hypothetical protein VNH83_26165, partial [Bryobacteraceae bacterium]|nr:hypothetical protein [Bryobacteraceae bacterium]